MPRDLLYREGVFRCANLIPKFVSRPICHWTARRIADLAWHLAPKMRALTEDNFRKGLGFEGAALTRMVRRNFSRFSESLSDYFGSIACPTSWSDKLVTRYEGEEHLKTARETGKGALIVTAHFGSWEMGGVLVRLRGNPLTVVTLREPSVELDRWRRARREERGIKTLTIGQDPFALIEIVRALERGECVAMLVDRPTGGDGVTVPFLGRPTPFSSAPAMIWQHVGVPVHPAHVIRQPDGRYISAIGDPLPFARGSDRREALVANTALVADYFSRMIGAYPDQWFNYTPMWGAE
jgi:KDO2-lipid IV(A) lauroyltransferase